MESFEHDVILRNNQVAIEPDLEYTRIALGTSLDVKLVELTNFPLIKSTENQNKNITFRRCLKQIDDSKV